MSDLRKAAEMALEVFGGSDWGEEPFDSSWTDKANATVEALRQALAQPEQEPVAGMFEEKLLDQNPPPWSQSYRLKRDWVGLTDKDRKECWLVGIDHGWVGIIDATEAKLKEKNT